MASPEAPELHEGITQDSVDALSDANAFDSQSQEPTEGQPVDSVFQLTVRLPHAPHKTDIMVSAQEQVQDVRQSLIDSPSTFQYSCFHLEHNGERINDFIELSEVPGLSPGSELHLVEDPYTEKEARIHIVRIRELVGAAGSRVDTLHGISAGLSLHDEINAGEITQNSDGKNTLSKEAHPMVNYDLDSPGSLKTLIPAVREPAPRTLKAIYLSSWNPPPYYLRQKGHLLYLQITTNEGEQYHITSHVSGFFVNKSSNNKFDPFPKALPKSHKAHSLLSLLAALSPSFNESFARLQEYNNQKDPLSTFQLTNAIPANPWVVPLANSSISSHQADLARTQENYLISGVETSETLRDWNEEFQSTRELPRETVQDRVFRERLACKLYADFNDAAARGAVLVAKGEVAPLNPTEERDAQIFVYNNVFFSFGADGVGTFANEGGDEAARVATGKDVLGVKAVNQLDIPGLFTPGTVVVDYLGKRLVGQSIVPGIFKQREPGEHQIDYGGVEGKDVVAENEGFAPLFEKVSKAFRAKKHAVWDKEGTRHELEASVETKGLLGTDGRKYVLDLYRITPLDVSWLEGQRDAENQNVAQNGQQTPYPHRMAVLRPELVESYWRARMRDFVRTEVDHRRDGKNEEPDESTPKERISEKSSSEPSAFTEENENGTNEHQDQASGNSNEALDRIDLSKFQLGLNPDVFSGQVPQTPEEKAEWAKDEAEVRAACKYLTTDVLPALVQHLKDGDTGFPMDGQSLTRLLHKRGINIRYLGEIAILARLHGPRLEALESLAIQEMTSRAFKHIANRYLRYLPGPFAAPCIAHLLNCFLGSKLNSNPVPEIDESLRALYPEGDFAFEKVTPGSLQKEVEGQVCMRFRYDLKSVNWTSRMKHLQLLREVSLKLGLQLEAKEYCFKNMGEIECVKSELPTLNGSSDSLLSNGTSNGSNKRKKKAVTRGSTVANVSAKPPISTFGAENILNIAPIVKDASPRSSLAEEALEAGRISLAQNQKELGQELILESLSLHEQIYGILHPEVARVYYQLSMLYYSLDEKSAALELARKSVIVSERTLGIDSAETILGYLNLGLFEHANANTNAALVYVRHALELWKVTYGIKHPDSITTINNAAVMLQHLKQYHDSRLWFEASLAISEELSGRQSINTATLLFQLAQALALDQDSKSAVNRMREAYNVFLTQLGPEDKNTKEAESWLEQLTQNAVSVAKHAKDLQARRLRRVNATPRVTMGTRPQPQVGQIISPAIGQDIQASSTLDSRNIDELLKFIEGGDTAKRTAPKKRPGRGNPKRRGGGSVGT
ncbi:eukaryotic translation initiation factor-like protein 3 subunit CLU1/TIF31 [Xylona heveae TC161]|uniref:Clustered mitochondria protein homolog n=1 Tax=Xylona heveae (strain CBS 132557 / TC161) TaxID=1328760 RepID=A0A165GIK5_XYLHT|nr:eukaryotic translation initiation factor-like protein 3 subunit CLU1/TIF31 [Xylona heveae TC161]KZF22228.1 eukaryotic translation initiation factor-like protein 3 subunit CLU1/TIF31 [Xylona heveae TC161]